MKRIVIILALALSFFAAPLKVVGTTVAEVSAVATELNERAKKKFELWNDCKPMHLKVVVNMLQAYKFELTEAEIHQMITRIMSNRLLSAYLYKSDAVPFLKIFIFGSMLSDEIRVRATYNKALYDPVSEIYSLAPAWQSNMLWRNLPFQSRGVQDINNTVSGLVDDFIIAYQNVNADACPHH